MRAARPLLGIAAAVALLAGACALTSEPVLSKLDPRTSVTITYNKSPLIFLRSLSDYMSDSKEYVYLGPLEVNRSGDYRYYLWLATWSTMDSGQNQARDDRFESVDIIADGQAITLALSGAAVQSLGASEAVYPKPVAWASDLYYKLTVEQLREIAAATILQVRFATSGETFEPWDDQRSGKAGLNEFLIRTQF